MAQLFLSYASKNADRAAQIAGGLQSTGYSLWWDDFLKAGDRYANVIEAEIAEASGVVVCWSAEAKESLWVRAEATEALDTGKLVQLKIDGSRMPLPFNMIQMIDFSRWPGGTGDVPWPELDREVAQKTGAASLPEAPGAASVPGGRMQGLGPAVVIGFALGLVAILFALATVALAGDALSVELYRGAAMAGLGAALLGGMMIGLKLVRTLAATRRG
ncbi:MAG: toll/interleukin-1 receptor domain-containing protein [Parasphingopyxis sp.]|uniref:toll/interleukin-1 receptor domain-containing protein n=1 Tax=Parasphingopyxis sp. TaxID=1920299 RepID=UPI0032EC2D29